ncbi:MAG: hypothetical protein R3E83_19695 [Burkholderiaceae bacterium]
MPTDTRAANGLEPATHPPLETEILTALATLPEIASLPRVRALLLPPCPWNGHRDAEFAALELEDGTIGLASRVQQFSA